MKHTTKSAPAAHADGNPKQRMIGLRLDEAEMALVQRLAKDQERSLAQMARIALRRGIEALNQGA